MDEKEILNILSKGENHTTEFKKSQTSITKDVSAFVLVSERV